MDPHGWSNKYNFNWNRIHYITGSKYNNPPLMLQFINIILKFNLIRVYHYLFVYDTGRYLFIFLDSVHNRYSLKIPQLFCILYILSAYIPDKHKVVDAKLI